MSKRKNNENISDTVPTAKRIRNTQPLRDSKVINTAADLECPILYSSSDEQKEADLCSPDPKPTTPTEIPPSAIATVPAEIMDTLFRLLLLDDYAFTYGGFNISKISHFSAPRKALSALSGVSKLWRGIATRARTAVEVVTTHGIWDNASSRNQLEEVSDRVQKYVEDRGLVEEPTILQVGPLGRSPMESETDPLPEGFLTAILAFVNIQSLVLTSIDAVALARIPSSALLPHMKTLVLKLHDSDINELAANKMKISLFKDAISLTHATIVNALLGYTEDPAAPRTNLLELPFDNVTHILENHRDFDTEPLPSVFYNLDELINLTFLWIRMPKDLDQANLERLGPFVLPNLLSLTIDATPSSEVDRVPGVDLIDHIHATSLKHLGLIGHTLDFDDAKWAQKDAGGARFLNKLASLPDLDSLSLSYPRIHQKSFTKVLAAAKGVKHLDLHITASKEDYRVVFDAITLQESNVDPVLPLLKRLSFDVTNQRETWPAHMGVPAFTTDDLSDADPLAAFIKSRRGSELPDGVVQIDEVVMFTYWDEERREKWSIDLGENEDVLTYRHLAVGDYTHLRHGFQRDRALERTRCLDDAYEAKQFYACGPLYREL